MPAKATSRRLSRLEAKTARGKLLVCRCATRNGRRNVNEHAPDCPAAAAAPRDVVLKVTYATRP